MSIDIQRFCVNRKIAPGMGIEPFFQLVARLGLNKVELRNDMTGGRVTDDLSSQAVRELAQRYGIEILSINALYPFNCPDDALMARAKALLETAKETDARALVLCPLNDGTPVAARQTIDALRQLAPLFAEYDVEGLVEPLGFPFSSLRSAREAAALIHEAGAPFRLLVDTFHHALWPDAERELATLDINRVGLVHLSGVEDPRPMEQLTDEQRIMLSDSDRLSSAAQVRRLEELGYHGAYSFEPFSSVMESWSGQEIERQIRQGMALIQQACG